MPVPSTPFPLPTSLDKNLAHVLAYWESLKRADNNMPFWDDVKLSALPDLADRLLLIDVFTLPERFRFRTVGSGLAQRYGEVLNGKFPDEMNLRVPFGYLRAQCSATVESRAPTFHADAGYSRILMPMWGDGHIGMLLGAIDWR